MNISYAEGLRYYTLATELELVVGSLIYITAFYYLTFRTPLKIKQYTYYLLNNVLWGFLFEVHLTGMAPIYMFPIPACYTSGVFRRMPFGQFHVFWTNCVLLHVSTVSLFHIFWYRMRVMMTFTVERQKIVIVCNAYIFCTYSCVLTIYPVLSMVCGDDEIRRSIAEEFENVPIEFWSNLTIVFDRNINGKEQYAFMAILGVSLDMLALFAFPMGTVYVLKSMQGILSKKTLQLHRSILRALFIQFGVHASLLIFPFLLTQLSNVLPLFDYVALNWLVFLNKFHGSASTFAMLLANAHIRNDIIDDFRRCDSLSQEGERACEPRRMAMSDMPPTWLFGKQQSKVRNDSVRVATTQIIK